MTQQPSPPTEVPFQRSLIQQALDESYRWLTTVLRARGVESTAVEDVLQEVRVTALEKSAKLQDQKKVAPWLYRIAVTSALQHRRKMGRKRHLVERYAATKNETTYSAEPDPLAWLLADEQRQLVRQAIEALSPKEAEILLLKHTEDWSYRQLAEHLGISESAVDARLHRARQKLRNVLTHLAPALVPRTL